MKTYECNKCDKILEVRFGNSDVILSDTHLICPNCSGYYREMREIIELLTTSVDDLEIVEYESKFLKNLQDEVDRLCENK